jgi:anti-anti-sigma regulatory factor
MSLRKVTIALLLLQATGALLIAANELISGRDLWLAGAAGATILIYLGLTFAYWRGWEPARYVAIVLTVLATIFGSREPFLTEQISLAVVTPLVLAQILTTPAWVAGTAIAMLGGLLVRANFTGIYADPVTIVLYLIIGGGVVLSQLVTNMARRTAEESAARAEEARLRSEGQAQELAYKADELAAQNEQQRRLLDLVATLETPAVALAEGVLLAPVVGHLDSRRAKTLTSRLLNEVSAQRARLVILDIAGVSTVDTEVAQSLIRAIQALRLLGCSVTITGISAAVAATMTTLGINMRGIDTARTPQEALEQVAVKEPRRPALTNGVHQP